MALNVCRGWYNISLLFPLILSRSLLHFSLTIPSVVTIHLEAEMNLPYKAATLALFSLPLLFLCPIFATTLLYCRFPVSLSLFLSRGIRLTLHCPDGSCVSVATRELSRSSGVRGSRTIYRESIFLGAGPRWGPVNPRYDGVSIPTTSSRQERLECLNKCLNYTVREK